MSKDINSGSVEASGHFSLNVKENDQEEETVPTSRLAMLLESGLLHIAGWAGTSPKSQGVEITISEKIEAHMTYPFESDIAVGNYNPKNFADSSWSSVSHSGEISLEEVDLLKKTAKGSFKFTARALDGKQSAEIHGNFNLQ